MLEWLARTADLAMAWYDIRPNTARRSSHLRDTLRYLNAHVRAGYKFLMQNYRQGDKICMFGEWNFSRTARQSEVIDHIMYQDSPVAPIQPGRWQGCCLRYTNFRLAQRLRLTWYLDRASSKGQRRTDPVCVPALQTNGQDRVRSGGRV